MAEQNRIVVLSDGGDIPDAVRAALQGDRSATVEAVDGTLARLNGTAYTLLARNDLMIFEIDLDDEAQLGAVEALSARRGEGKTLIAMADGEVSLSKARRLRALGVDEVLPVGISPQELRASLSDVLRSRKAVAAPADVAGVVLAFAQARGGIGSTTVAVNVALALAKTRKGGRKSPMNRVVLVDLDVQFGTANVLLDLEDNGGFFKLIEAREEPDATYMRTVIQHHGSGLDVVSAPVMVAPLHAIRAPTISAMLDSLQTQYDYVVVDLPRALVDWIEPVLERCARLAIVTDTSVPSVRHSRRLIDFFKEANISLQFDVVVNREKKPFLPARHVREAEQALGLKISHWLPDNPKVARNAADYGVPVVTHASRSDLARALARLASKLESTRPVAGVRAAH
jgi:pilus assembly protein CpaE